jgi:hypothetical protein
MKKGLLFSLFTLLSVAAFAQYGGGCGPDPHSASSQTNNIGYGHTQAKPAVKVDYTVFPNPATDAFRLDAESVEKGTASKVNVYNAMGQLLRTFTVEKDTRYNVSDLKEGMYFIQLLDAKGKTITTRKLNKAATITRF